MEEWDNAFRYTGYSDKRAAAKNDLQLFVIMEGK
jgi:hypothetical protein